MQLTLVKNFLQPGPAGSGGGRGPYRCAAVELPRLARPEGCCYTYCLALRGVRA